MQQRACRKFNKRPCKAVLQCSNSELYRWSQSPICQSLSWQLMPSLDAQIIYVKYQQMNSGRELFCEQSETLTLFFFLAEGMQ